MRAIDSFDQILNIAVTKLSIVLEHGNFEHFHHLHD